MFHILIQLHDGRLVSHSVVGVPCAEYCHDLLFMSPLEALIHDLMSSTNKIQSIRVIELTGLCRPKNVASTSLTTFPPIPRIFGLCGVRPKQVTDAAFMWHLSKAVNLIEFINVLHTW